MNMGMGPTNKISFPMANGQQPQQPPQPKAERAPTYSLYIGNLSQKTFDLDLYKFF